MIMECVLILCLLIFQSSEKKETFFLEDVFDKIKLKSSLS